MLKITQKFNKFQALNTTVLLKSRNTFYLIFIDQCFTLVELQVLKIYTFKHFIYKLKHCLSISLTNIQSKLSANKLI